MTPDEQNLAVPRLYWPVQKIGRAQRLPPCEMHETKGQAARRAKSAVFWRKGVTIVPTSTIFAVTAG